MRTFGSIPESQLSSANVVLALLLIGSPWLLQFFGSPTPTTVSELTGVLIVLCAWSAALDTTPIASWWTLALAAWLVISPFVLGYFAVIPALVGHLVLGLLIGWISFTMAIRRSGEPVIQTAPAAQRRRIRA